VGTPLILLVGVPGNVLAIVVIKSKRFTGKSYIHYLTSLAVFDLLVLVLKYVRRVDSLLEALGLAGIFARYDATACKLHNFGEHLCYLMSSWLVLCMTLERFVAVVLPFHRDKLCKPRSAVITIILVFMLLAYSQVFRLVIIENNGYSCTAPERYLKLYVTMHIYMYQLALLFMVPASLVLVFNVTILYKIRKLRQHYMRRGIMHSSSQQHHHHSSSSSSGGGGGGGGGPQYNVNTRTTCMLLAVSFTYVVTMFPLALLSMILHVASRLNPSLARFMIFRLNDVRYVCELVSEMNYVVNFYIYVLSSAKFRYQLKYIMARRYTSKSSGQTEKVFQFRRS
jgi:uncharacterized membrane protein YgcG